LEEKNKIIMFNRNRPVSRRGVPGIRASAGIGYIVVPTDAGSDPETYRKMCIQKQTVSLISEFERIDNVRIPKHILVDLVFPEFDSNSKIQKVGSAIVWVNIPKWNQPVAVGVLTKDSELTSILPDSFSIKKETKNSNIEISGNANEGLLVLTVDAKSSLKNKLLINVLNSEEQGELDVNVNGNILTEAIRTQIKSLDELNIIIKNDVEDSESETLINYSRGIGFSYSDEFGNVITIDKDGKFDIRNKDYSLKGLFNDIITEVSNITTQTSIGVQPALNKTQIINLKNKVTKILK